MAEQPRDNGGGNDLIPETAEGEADSTGIVKITALYGVLYLGCTAEKHEDT